MVLRRIALASSVALSMSSSAFAEGENLSVVSSCFKANAEAAAELKVTEGTKICIMAAAPPIIKPQYSVSPDKTVP